MTHLIDPSPDAHPLKEDTGLGGTVLAEGAAHGLRGVAFLIGLAIVAVLAIFTTAALHP